MQDTPVAVLPLPTVFEESELTPVAVFEAPMVLLRSAAVPMAVFWVPSPVVWFPTLKRSDPAPTAVL
jgi:hypothetical protein